MVRVVLTCLLAVAIAGVVLPTADAARADATTAEIGLLVDDITRATTTLSAVEDPTPAGVAGVQRHIVLDVPSGSWRAAGVSNLTVRGGDGVGLSTSVTAGSTVVRRVDGPWTCVAGDRLTLGSDEYRLRLMLEAATGSSVIVIAPAIANQSVA